MRLRWPSSSGSSLPTPGGPACSTANSCTPRCPARRRRSTRTSSRPRSAATRRWCVSARGASTWQPRPRSRRLPRARARWPGGSAASACRTCAPSPTRPPSTTGTPCTWRNRRTAASCWPTARRWPAGSMRARWRMRRSGRTLRSRPSLRPAAETPDPSPAARACAQRRRKYRAKRALPGPSAAGPGRKRLRRSRTANGPRGSPLVRSLNTSLLLPTPGGSHGLCIPGSGEGGSPLHYTVNPFSDLYACPAALRTSRLPHRGEGSSTPPCWSQSCSPPRPRWCGSAPAPLAWGQALPPSPPTP